MAPTPTRRCHLGCGSVLLIIAIGFSCAELAIFVTGKYHPLPQSTQCPNLNLNATAGVFKLQKQL